MSADRRAAAEAQIQAAIREVDRALAASWRKPNGESAEGNLRQLRETLQGAQDQLGSGLIPDDPRLIGMTKWVADWIPETDAPLLRALDGVELELQG